MAAVAQTTAQLYSFGLRKKKTCKHVLIKMDVVCLINRKNIDMFKNKLISKYL